MQIVVFDPSEGRMRHRMIGFAVIVFFVTSLGDDLLGQDRFGKFGIGVRDKNPARLKWEDVCSAYEGFRADYFKQYSDFVGKTHDLFHGKFEEYFARLPNELRARLMNDYSLL